MHLSAAQFRLHDAVSLSGLTDHCTDPRAIARTLCGQIVGEIGEVLNGEVKGRESESEITLFKSLGCALEDLTAAAMVYAKSVEEETPGAAL